MGGAAIMNKLIYIIPLVVALIGGVQLTHATNESSYRYGVHLAINNLTNQIVPPWNVDEDNPSPNWNVTWPSHFFMNPDICNLDSADNGCPSMGDVQAVYCTTGQPDHPQVTNSTECFNGYLAGWKTWCTEDNYNNSKYCTDLVFGGNTKDGSDFPGALFDEVMSNQSAHFKSIKNYVDSWRYFCTKDGYKNAKTCTKDVFVKNNFPGTFMNENKTLLSIMPLQSLLSGSTWNFVNESNGKGMDIQGPYINPSYNEIMKVAQKRWAFVGGVSPGQPIMFMSNMTHFKGNITFYWYQIKIKDTHGLDPTYTSNPSWKLGDNHTLVLDGITPTVVDSLSKDGSRWFPPTTLTIDRLSSHFIELTDPHGDIIELSRGGIAP